MPTTQADYARIEESRKKAGALGQRALSLQAGAQTFSDRVMKDVRSARAERGTSLLAQDVGTTTGQLVTGGPDIRSRLAEVNPLQTDVITARERAGTLGTLATQAMAQEGIEGTIQDVIGGGVNQLKSAALLKQAEAAKATDEANTLLEQLQFKEAEAAREFDEWATREQLKQGWVTANKPAGGGQSALEKLVENWILSSLGGQDGDGVDEGGDMPTEPKPTTTPSKKGIQYHSSGGEWMYNWDTNEWIPTGDYELLQLFKDFQ